MPYSSSAGRCCDFQRDFHAERTDITSSSASQISKGSMLNARRLTIRRDGETAHPEAAADEVALALGVPEFVVARAKACGDFGKGVAGAGGMLPILAEARDLQIVPGHGVIDVEDAVSAGAHAAAELGLFAGDQFGVVASGFFEGAAAHEDVASAELGDAGRVDPVEIEDAVVDGCFGMYLAAMAPDGDDGWVLAAWEQARR